MFVWVGCLVFSFAACTFVAAQEKYKPGDRVECDKTGSGKFWEKGTVIEFKENDIYNGNGPESGYFYRVRIDKDVYGPSGRFCKTAEMRPLTENPAENPLDPNKPDVKPASDTGKVSADEDNTLSADRPLLECPIKQKAVKRGAAPDTQLFGKLIRCLWEKPALKGADGAMTVDIKSMKIGSPRPWNELRDLNNDGDRNTIVYPVETTYVWKTFYRTRTIVKESTNIFNCYVNNLNEWRCGAGIKIKDGESISIPRQ
jgi:hypothetical protein